MVINCDFCSKEFKTYPNWFKRNKYHCCSRECSDKLKIKINTKVCPICNAEFHKKNHQDLLIYCSKKCFGISKRGENHHNYKDGVFIHPEILRKWSKKVKKRDEYKCILCDRKDVDILQAHHIKEKSLFPELSLDVDNGITLCVYCHREQHLNDSRVLVLLDDKIKRYEESKMGI